MYGDNDATIQPKSTSYQCWRECRFGSSRASTSPACRSAEGRGLTELEGLKASWESVSGGNWKSAGSFVFLMLALRADLLLVVAACGGRADNSAFSLRKYI